MFPLKRLDEPLNIDRLAFAVAHPAMLRRMVFAVEESLPTDVRTRYGFKKGGGYGTPCDAPEDMRGDLYFGEMHGGDGRWGSPDSASAAALEMLAEAGIIEKQEA